MRGSGNEDFGFVTSESASVDTEEGDWKGNIQVLIFEVMLVWL